MPFQGRGGPWPSCKLRPVHVQETASALATRNLKASGQCRSSSETLLTDQCPRLSKCLSALLPAPVFQGK